MFFFFYRAALSGNPELYEVKYVKLTCILSEHQFGEQQQSMGSPQGGQQGKLQWSKNP